MDKSTEREYGRGTLNITGESDLFKGIPSEIKVWNSHVTQSSRSRLDIGLGDITVLPGATT